MAELGAWRAALDATAEAVNRVLTHRRSASLPIGFGGSVAELVTGHPQVCGSCLAPIDTDTGFCAERCADHAAALNALVDMGTPVADGMPPAPVLNIDTTFGEWPLVGDVVVDTPQSQATTGVCALALTATVGAGVSS